MRIRWSWDLGVIGPSVSYSSVCDIDNEEDMRKSKMRAGKGHARWVACLGQRYDIAVLAYVVYLCNAISSQLQVQHSQHIPQVSIPQTPDASWKVRKMRIRVRERNMRLAEAATQPLSLTDKDAGSQSAHAIVICQGNLLWCGGTRAVYLSVCGEDSRVSPALEKRQARE